MSTTTVTVEELALMSRDKLRTLATKAGVRGVKKMGKQQLIDAITARGSRPGIAERLNGREGLIAWFDDFSGPQPWDFLSNFFEGEPIVLDVQWGQLAYWFKWTDEQLQAAGIDPDLYVQGATGEHLFAAFKTRDLDEFLGILEAPDPGAAKGAGRSRRLSLRADWEAVKYDVMAMVLRAKFTLERDEGQWLINTGDSLLIEGTYWSDRVWGVDLKDTSSDPLKAWGRNWLGTLLMARRAELIAEQAWGHAYQASLTNLGFILD